MSNGGSGQHPPAPASREIHPWCETRGHGAHSFAPGDRGFGSRSLHRRVYCEPDFLGSRSIKHAFTHKPPSSTTILSLSRTGASSPRPSKQASLAPSPCAWTGYKQASLSVKLGPPEPTSLLARPGSGFQFLADQLCELGYGGPRHRTRLLSAVGPRLRLRNDEAHPLLIDRFGWPCCTYPTASRKMRHFESASQHVRLRFF